MIKSHYTSGQSEKLSTVRPFFIIISIRGNVFLLSYLRCSVICYRLQLHSLMYGRGEWNSNWHVTFLLFFSKAWILWWNLLFPLNLNHYSLFEKKVLLIFLFYFWIVYGTVTERIPRGLFACWRVWNCFVCSVTKQIF